MIRHDFFSLRWTGIKAVDLPALVQGPEVQDHFKLSLKPQLMLITALDPLNTPVLILRLSIFFMPSFL